MKIEKKQRLFVDMDGTLAVFSPVDQLEVLYEKGYFKNLLPQVNVLEAVKHIIENHPEIEVNILSAYLSDSAYALDEKNAWLDMYLPEINKNNRIFIPCGSDKAGVVEDLGSADYLLDDYTDNLKAWEPPARGIKLLTDINNTHGSWTSDRIRFDKPPAEIAQSILSVMLHGESVRDENPKRRGSDTSAIRFQGDDIIGVVSWHTGDREAFTSLNTFLSVLNDELPYRATSGFQFSVLSEDPFVRKSIDDLVFGHYGEENPHSIDTYFSEKPALTDEIRLLSERFRELQSVYGIYSDVLRDAYAQRALIFDSSNQSKSYLYGKVGVRSVAVFGDPINVLAHASIERALFNDYTNVDRVVVSDGDYSALKKILDDAPDIKYIKICFDASASGNAAAMKLKTWLLNEGYTAEKNYHCERLFPAGFKDYTEYLRQYREALEDLPQPQDENPGLSAAEP